MNALFGQAPRRAGVRSASIMRRRRGAVVAHRRASAIASLLAAMCARAAEAFAAGGIR
jgi:hypothetical protein